MSPLANLNEDALQILMRLPIGGWQATDLLLARESLGLTQAELATAVGYDRSAIAKIEGGDVSPRLVVELAVRYLVDHRPQGSQLTPKEPFDVPRFRPPGTPIGVSEAGFPGGIDVDVYLADGPAIWLRLMPEFDSGRRFSATALKNAATQSGFPLVQLIDGCSNLGFVRGADGFGVFGMIGDRSLAPTVSFIFDTAEIWSIDTLTVNAMKPATGGWDQSGMVCPEDRFKYATHWFRELLRRLGLHPPLRWVVGMEGIKNTGLYYAPPVGRYFPVSAPHGRALVDVVCETGIMNEADTPASALQPFFQKVFNVFGLERPDYLDNLANPQ
jgi:DNA-binding XRE family transcriptional regulator